METTDKPREKPVVDTTDKSIDLEKAIHNLALSRFRTGTNADNHNRIAAREDLRMLAGFDHWPSKIEAERAAADRPCLVINRLPAFADQVLNEVRINKTGIKVIPKGSGATQELANLYTGIIREIEDNSDAPVAYETGAESAANNGFGWIKIIREWSDDSGFEQDLKIKRIRNPMTVVMDPRAEEPDGSDANWFFISELISKSEYEAQHSGSRVPTPLELQGDDFRQLWYEKEDLVRVAEYWVKEPYEKTIYLLDNGEVVDSEEWEEFKAEKEALGETEGLPTIKRERTVKSHKIRMYLIDGQGILETHDEPGKYIPIVPVWGKELDIDGEVHRRGVIRFAKDPQRMYDYFKSAAAETVALAPKAPYLIDDRQLGTHKDMWDALGRKNYPYLPYKSIPGVDKPSREVVTQTAIGEITEASAAIDDMKATTNVYNASLGDQGREISGRAIRERTARTDVANYTYYDNLLRALKHVGRILVDLIPHVYDTERQMLLMDEMGKQYNTTVNQQAGDKIVNDLSVGRYKISVTTGPRFTTQRQEAAQSLMDFIRVAPDAASIIIDIVAEYQDWPGAARIAQRLRQHLGIDEEGNIIPRKPSQDEVFTAEKIRGSQLNSMKKTLDIVEKRRELEGQPAQYAQAGAQGAMSTIMPQEGGNA